MAPAYSALVSNKEHDMTNEAKNPCKPTCTCTNCKCGADCRCGK